MVLIMVLGLSPAHAGDCVQADIGATGGTLRADGVAVSVPAGLWSRDLSVELCEAGTSAWALHLPVRVGTDASLKEGIVFHVEPQTAQTTTDILFTLDRSCSMSETSVLDIDHAADLPLVDHTVGTGRTESLTVTVVTKGRDELVVEAD